VADPREDQDEAVRSDGLAVCGLAHAEPIWLGAIRGTEWWHCRSCGWVWHELRPVEPADSGAKASEVVRPLE
jgi:hypothetical protein